jgi:FkbM family methyltransferase
MLNEYMHLVSYPVAVGPDYPPTLSQEPIILHQFSFGPKMWLQTGNQWLERYGNAKAPYQHANLMAFKSALADTAKGVILDIGANVGMMSHQFALWGATVIAFEPTPKLAEMAAHNLRLNGTSNRVTIYQNAVLDKNGPVVFRDIPNQGYINALVKPNTSLRPGTICSRFTADAITIDSLNLPHVDGIKIDTEGHELWVCKGAAETIKRCRPVVMAEIMRGHTCGYQPQDMYDWFFDLDYLVFDKGHRTGRCLTKCSSKWTHKRNFSDKIFIPKERDPQPLFDWG